MIQSVEARSKSKYLIVGSTSTWRGEKCEMLRDTLTKRMEGGGRLGYQLVCIWVQATDYTYNKLTIVHGIGWHGDYKISIQRIIYVMPKNEQSLIQKMITSYLT